MALAIISERAGTVTRRKHSRHIRLIERHSCNNVVGLIRLQAQLPDDFGIHLRT